MLSVRSLCVFCVSVADARGHVGRASAQPGAWPQWRGPARDGVARGTASGELAGALTKSGRSPSAAATRRQSSPTDASSCTPVTAMPRPSPPSTPRRASSSGSTPPRRRTRSTGGGLARPWPEVDRRRMPAAALHASASAASSPAYDGASGKVVWRKQPSAEQPTFGTATSPLVVDGVVVVFVGGHERGRWRRLDAVSGVPKWQWTGGAPAYASPVVATLAGVKQLITQSRTHVVGVALDGALLWQIPLDDALRPELRDADRHRRPRSSSLACRSRRPPCAS